MKCADTKFHKDWVRHSKVDRRDAQIQRSHGHLISLLLFLQNKENRLKRDFPRRIQSSDRFLLLHE
jgi:hypothetical protein